ncbi:MAG TPA: SDR family NAD(P)-dependent oxidoreductase [Novosphingobium sp.]
MQVDQGQVVITGTGGGIGLGLAREFAQRGYRVLALVRSLSRRAALDEAIAGLEHLVTVQELDVTRIDGFAMPEDVSILVNNAGIRNEYLALEQLDMAEWREYFDINFFGVVELTRLAIPLMRQARRGTICNINSSSLFFPMPFLAPYRATKAAMAAYSETLRAELAPFGVRVVEIFPGPIASALSAGGILHKRPAAASHPAYEPMATRQRENQIAMALPIQSAAEGARRIVDDILDANGPMRRGTCAASDQGLELWRPGHGGEPLIAAGIAALLP